MASAATGLQARCQTGFGGSVVKLLDSGPDEEEASIPELISEYHAAATSQCI